MAGENPILYSAAKGGIAELQQVARPPGGAGIRVNILAPGFIETAFGEGADEQWRREVVERRHSGAGACPRTSPAPRSFWPRMQSRFVTGQMIMVNGGVVM